MSEPRQTEVNEGLKTPCVFRRALVEKAELYREILAVFSRLCEQFIAHLRPAEIARTIDIEEEEVDAALR